MRCALCEDNFLIWLESLILLSSLFVITILTGHCPSLLLKLKKEEKKLKNEMREKNEEETDVEIKINKQIVFTMMHIYNNSLASLTKI